MSYGVAVGLIMRNVFPESIIADLNRFFARNGIPGQDIPNVFMSPKSVVLRDKVGNVESFTEGTTCNIASDNEDDWKRGFNGLNAGRDYHPAPEGLRPAAGVWLQARGTHIP